MVVIVFIILDWIFVSMNTTAMILCRYVLFFVVVVVFVVFVFVFLIAFTHTHTSIITITLALITFLTNLNIHFQCIKLQCFQPYCYLKSV